MMISKIKINNIMTTHLQILATFQIFWILINFFKLILCQLAHIQELKRIRTFPKDIQILRK